MTEEQLISAIAKLQELSINWSPSRKVVVTRSTAVPEYFQTEYLDLLKAIQVFGVNSNGQPDFRFFQKVTERVSQVSFYAGEKDSFGWVTGVMRVNNLEIVFG